MVLLRKQAFDIVAESARQIGCAISHMDREDKRSAQLTRARKLAAWVMTQDYGMTQAEAAEALGRSRASIALLLRDLRRLMNEKPKIASQFKHWRAQMLEKV